jgi:hypothetical protein
MVMMNDLLQERRSGGIARPQRSKASPATQAVPTNAILYLSHFNHKKLWCAYQNLQGACAGFGETYFVLNQSSDLAPAGATGESADKANVFTVTPALRTALGHSALKVSKGGDQAILAFRQLNPHFDYYWIVEYDVQFSGNWRALFDAFAENTSDLLCTSLHRIDTNPTWRWWRSLNWPADPKPELIRGFFPFARVSARALDAIIAAMQAGISGHYELTWPTVVHHSGMAIEDIGGDGQFVHPCNRNRWYTSTPKNENLSPGTVVYRPTRLSPGRRPDTLWHPVKHSLVDYVRGTGTYARMVKPVKWVLSRLK